MIMPNLAKLAQLELVEVPGDLNLVRIRNKESKKQRNKNQKEDTFSGFKMPIFKQS